MKKAKILVAILLVVSVSVAAWFIGYHSSKSNDNIPTKEMMVSYCQNKGEDYATEILRGYKNTQLIEVWGKPEGNLFGFWGDIWETNTNYYLVIYYDSEGLVNLVKADSNTDSASDTLHATIPTLFDVKSYLPEDFTASMANITREELLEAWGDPSNSSTEFNYDSWRIDDESAVTIDWDENGILKSGSISMR